MAEETVEPGRNLRRPAWLPKPPSLEAGKEIVAALVEAAFPTKRFYTLLALATTIAAFGLLANSPAVIIGAMIVAPLMGPILGLSLGMVSSDHRLERNALLAEVTGVAMAVGLGYLAGLIPLNLGVSAEMLARTSPTTYDLAIAVASGLAGAYVSVNRKVNSALAGVAISVALVPPLATTGLLLAMGHHRASLGSFLLFLANFFSIQLASALVFAVYGLKSRTRPSMHDRFGMAIRFAPALLALGLMGWFMTGTLLSLVRRHSMEDTVRRVLDEEIARRTGGRLEAILRQDDSTDRATVVVSALTPRVFEAAQVGEMETRLRTELREEVSLVLRSLVSQDVDHSGRVFLDNEERLQSQSAREEADYLRKATEILEAGLKRHRGTEIDHLERHQTGAKNLLVALVRGPQAVEPEVVGELEDKLRSETGGDVRLILRNVATRDTDRSGFLYETKPEEAPPPDPQREALRARVRQVLEIRMRSKSARSLQELSLSDISPDIEARAVVRATVPVRPEEVAAIQRDLRRFLDPRIRLTVRTVLESEADASGWTP